MLKSGCQLTHRCNDLRLKTELVLEATGKVANAALAIGRDVGHLANVVEHVAAGEEKDSDQADGSPQVAVLDNREEVRRSDEKEGQSSDDSGRDSDNLNIVDRADDRWVRCIGEMAAEPRVDGLGLVGANTVRMSVQGIHCLYRH